MKGKITMRSAPNIGTTFTLRIPTEGVSFEDHTTNNNNSSEKKKLV